MKPHELYMGAAPLALAQMGQSLPQVGANIASMYEQGSKQFGNAISEGINSAAKSYFDYKQLKSDTKASEDFYNSIKKSRFLDPEITNQIDSHVLSENYKNSSSQDKAAYWKNLQSYMGAAITQKAAMDKVLAEQGGATGRTILSEAGANTRNAASLASGETRQTQELKSLEERNRLNQTLGFMGNPGSTMLDKAGMYGTQFNSQTLNLGGGVYQPGFVK